MPVILMKRESPSKWLSFYMKYNEDDRLIQAGNQRINPAIEETLVQVLYLWARICSQQ